MSQKTYTFSHRTINEMKYFYRDVLTDAPQGAVFRAKTKHAVITAYNSGKVLFQGKKPQAEVEKWTDATIESENVNKPNHAYTPPVSLYTMSHIGSDEAGTGDYFGPITTCCTFVPQEKIPLLKELGVRDSKSIADTTIRQLAMDIIACDIPYTLYVLPNEKYNDLQTKGWSQGKMKTMLHHYAIQKLLKKIGTAQPKGILIDQFCEPRIYAKHLASEQETMTKHTYFITNAEKHSIAVAAASIIARTRFLQEIDKLSAKLGISLPKGAASHVNETIRTIVDTKGKHALNACAKVHFANTKKAIG